MIDGRTIQWSDMHGDLDSTDACLALKKTVSDWCTEKSTPIAALACDLHPDFYSSHVAVATAKKNGVPAVAVQHHHAHIASAIAARDIQKNVIGVALDGMGLGNDNTLWGGEILHVGGGINAHQWSRLTHLQAIALPGGDRASREPWRLAAAVLHECGYADQISPRFGSAVGESVSKVITSMLQKNLNCPPSSSCGRWFDAAAGALGISIRQNHEAEAAIALEQLAQQYLKQYPQFDWPWWSLNFYPIVSMLFDIESVAKGAAIFHLALINGLNSAITSAALAHDCKDIVLAGGCFANRILASRLIHKLQHAGFRVHTPADDRYGDDGLALGQAWIAACQLHADNKQTSLQHLSEENQ